MSNPLKTLKEKFLLFKVAHQRDKKAFGEIYNMYKDRLYRFVFYKVPKPEDAEDIVNDVFFKVWKFITTRDNSFEENQDKGKINNFAAFLYATARNAINDYYRTQGITLRIEEMENVEEIESLKSDSSNVEISLDREFDTNQLLQFIRSLKDEYREVLVMRYLDEMSFKEIAEVLGKSEGNVRVLLHRATESLKKKIESRN